MTNLHCVESEKGFFLTLRERKIMKLILDEAMDRTEFFGKPGIIQTPDQQMTNVYQLIGNYVDAYKVGNITLSDIERCG